MEPLRFEVLSVEKEPRRFLTPQHKFIERPEEAPASRGLRAGCALPGIALRPLERLVLFPAMLRLYRDMNKFFMLS